MPEIFDWYKRPKTLEEVNDGEEVVEKDGYIPADVQIQSMINAGMRLGEYRREMYDYGPDDEVPDDAIDTRSFTDPVEATRALNQVKARLEAQANQAATEQGEAVPPVKEE